eukprot:6611403-Pyramimonas_sp.AAC.1
MRWAAQACHCYSNKANFSARREGYLTDSHPTRLEALRRPGQALENLWCSVMLAAHEGAACSNCVRICCTAEGRAHPRGAS